jgi:hypothetical protein
MPSEAFLAFKDNHNHTSNQIQTIENSFSSMEDAFQSRVDVQLWTVSKSVLRESIIDHNLLSFCNVKLEYELTFFL